MNFPEASGLQWCYADCLGVTFWKRVDIKKAKLLAREKDLRLVGFF